MRGWRGRTSIPDRLMFVDGSGVRPKRPGPLPDIRLPSHPDFRTAPRITFGCGENMGRAEDRGPPTAPHPVRGTPTRLSSTLRDRGPDLPSPTTRGPPETPGPGEVPERPRAFDFTVNSIFKCTLYAPSPSDSEKRRPLLILRDPEQKKTGLGFTEV